MAVLGKSALTKGAGVVARKADVEARMGSRIRVGQGNFLKLTEAGVKEHGTGIKQPVSNSVLSLPIKDLGKPLYL